MKDLKSYLTRDSLLFSPEIEKDHPLRPILEKAFRDYTVSKTKQTNAPKILWNKERYNLQNSDMFMNLGADVQAQILRRITELNLSLSHFIEKSAVSYCGKMLVLADTIEMKCTYALFAAEEAIHLKEFDNVMDFKPDVSVHWHPMLDVLAEVIEQGEMNTCIYVNQILLEGFGIAHYNALKMDCNYPLLKDVFDRILFDEAKHHGAGLAFSKKTILSKTDKEQIFEYTRKFVRSLQSAGWLAKTIEDFSEEMSEDNYKKFWEQINYEKTLQARTKGLRDMFSKITNFDLVGMLEKEGSFDVVMPKKKAS